MALIGLRERIVSPRPRCSAIAGGSSDKVETPETVAGRIRRAFPHAGPDRLIAAPDGGMKYLPRHAAYRELEALVAGARIAAAAAPVTPG